jgi:hypothetical protein
MRADAKVPIETANLISKISKKISFYLSKLPGN